MIRVRVYRGLVMLAVLLLAACSAPKTPEEITLAFWQGVIAEDGAALVRYSTLEDGALFDGFGRDWTGAQLATGKVVIEGARARVSTQIGLADGGELSVTTFLRQEEGRWLVDFRLTADALEGADKLNRLLGYLDGMGRELVQQLEQATAGISANLYQFSQRLEALAGRWEGEAHQRLEFFGESLRDSLEGLAEAIRRSLEEMDEDLDPQDQQTLEQAQLQLQHSYHALEEPTMQGLAAASRSAALVRMELEGVDNRVFERYQGQWEQWLQRIDVDMGRAVREFEMAQRP